MRASTQAELQLQTVPLSCGNICSVCSTVSIAPCWQSRSTAPEQSARAESTFRPHFWIMELLMNCTQIKPVRMDLKNSITLEQ